MVYPAAPMLGRYVVLGVTFPMDVIAGSLPKGNEQSRAQQKGERSQSPFTLSATVKRQQAARGLEIVLVKRLPTLREA